MLLEGKHQSVNEMATFIKSYIHEYEQSLKCSLFLAQSMPARCFTTRLGNGVAYAVATMGRGMAVDKFSRLKKLHQRLCLFSTLIEGISTHLDSFFKFGSFSGFIHRILSFQETPSSPFILFSISFLISGEVR
ncbi:hypothetical protein V6N11_076840 [Hibiscus sabdariffa]|uniref:Exocyst subunit Exo70 family protein n=1 Tax=Hibiscus sabdariffa TaxID=183260 RepID=A0ABR2TBA0_9ROSI